MSGDPPPNLYAVSKYIQTSRPRWVHAYRRRDSLKPLGAPHCTLPRGSWVRASCLYIGRTVTYPFQPLYSDLFIVTNTGGSNEYSLGSVPETWCGTRQIFGILYSDVEQRFWTLSIDLD